MPTLTINELGNELIDWVTRLEEKITDESFAYRLSFVRNAIRRLVDHGGLDDITLIRGLSDAMDEVYDYYLSVIDYDDVYSRFVKYAFLELTFSWLHVFRQRRESLFDTTAAETHYYKYIVDVIDDKTIESFWHHLCHFVRKMNLDEEESKAWYISDFDYHQDKYLEVLYYYIAFHSAVYHRYKGIVPKYVAIRFDYLKQIMLAHYNDTHPDRCSPSQRICVVETQQGTETLSVDTIRLNYVFDKFETTRNDKVPAFLGNYTMRDTLPSAYTHSRKKAIPVRVKKKRTYVAPKESCE